MSQAPWQTHLGLGAGCLWPRGTGAAGGGVFTKLGLQTCRVSGRNYPFFLRAAPAAPRHGRHQRCSHMKCSLGPDVQPLMQKLEFHTRRAHMAARSPAAPSPPAGESRGEMPPRITISRHACVRGSMHGRRLLDIWVPLRTTLASGAEGHVQLIWRMHQLEAICSQTDVPAGAGHPAGQKLQEGPL